MTKDPLYQQLAEAIGVGDSVIIPKIFAILANADEARVLLAAAPPAPLEEIAEKAGLPVDAVEGMIEPLFKKGLMFKSKKEGKVRYYRVRQLFQFHDATIVTKDLPREFFELWKEYYDTEFKKHHRQFESILPNSVVRVVPVNIAVEPDIQVAAFEDIKQLVQSAENLAVTNCTCRLVDGSCGKPLEVCIQCNRSADYALERGTGRKITKEEALEILRMCEEEGLVHVVNNTRSIGHVICNCCEDCCINWPGPRQSGVNFAAPSRFTAVCDVDLCTECEVCVERCHFGAIDMDNQTERIDKEKCMGCGLCVVTCPVEAITLKEFRGEDFVPA
jgi:Pyruvate/2-oxoacid:ferredoxin oxidoreductase delta subunit